MNEGCYLGEVRLFAGNFAPSGWAYCDGGSLDIASNTALFSVLGVQYGGDGQRNFQLPNLPPVADGGTTPIRYIICVEGIYPTRN